MTSEERVKFATCSSANCSANDHKENSIDLNNRSRIDTSSPEIIVAYAKRDYRNGDKGSVIHILSRDRQL